MGQIEAFCAILMSSSFPIFYHSPYFVTPICVTSYSFLILLSIGYKKERKQVNRSPCPKMSAATFRKNVVRVNMSKTCYFSIIAYSPYFKNPHIFLSFNNFILYFSHFNFAVVSAFRSWYFFQCCSFRCLSCIAFNLSG